MSTEHTPEPRLEGRRRQSVIREKRMPPKWDAEVWRTIQFSLAGIPMGIVGALSAWILYHLINLITGLVFYGQLTFATPIYPPTQGLGARAIIIPVAGALIVGVMVRYGTDRIRGHGIPEAMEATLTEHSRIGLRVAIFKPISAAVAVGTGAPFGAEGPIIQTGGALGSLIGQLFTLTASERRVLLACGAAAGMVGIFNTPLSAVALAFELLLFELRPRSIIPVVIASAVAAGCRMVLMNGSVMFPISAPATYGAPAALIWFAPLGVAVGLCAVLISKGLYWVEELFDRLSLSLLFKPALGAVIVGIIALIEPRILGMGYVYITDALNGTYSTPTLAALAVGKSIALVFSLGAGSSGGLLAPLLFIGSSFGVIYGRGVRMLVPGAGLSPTLCGIVAMSGMFGSAARTPLTSFVFAFELTGDYSAVVPLMIGCMFADLTARALSRESVMTERLVKRRLLVPRSLDPNPFEVLRVSDAMRQTVDTISADIPLHKVVHALAGAFTVAPVMQGGATAARTSAALAGAGGTKPSARRRASKPPQRTDAPHPPNRANMANAPNPPNRANIANAPNPSDRANVANRWTLPVVDKKGRLVGITTRGDLIAAAQSPARLAQPISQVMTTPIVVTTPDEMLSLAAERMLAGGYGLLPVVAPNDPGQMVGALSRGDILRALSQRSERESHRQRYLLVGIGARRKKAQAPPQTPETGPFTPKSV